MANEINTIVKLTYTKGADQTIGSTNVTASQTGSHAIANVQAIGTTAETIDFSDIATAGPVMITNLDATNYVEIDSASAMTSFPQKLLPGESILLRPETVTIYAKAHTAACNIKVVAVEV